MIVCKFGGSSTAIRQGILNIKKVSLESARKIFVFSAIGKKNAWDEKLTDILLEYFASNHENKKMYLKAIKDKLKNLMYNTNAAISLNYYIGKIKNSSDKNYVVSRGEFLTSKIMAKYLGIKFVPAENLIKFHEGKLNEIKTKINLNRYLIKYKRFCTCGFYGADDSTGEIILFDRGGGDISGAIIAKLLRAKTYENYTDVCGIKEVSPNILNNSKTIKTMNYLDAEIISNYGGKVLHPSVGNILKNTDVKTKIINIFNLNGEKTSIYKHGYTAQFIGYKKCNKKIKIIIKTKNKKIKEIKGIKYNNNFYYLFCSEKKYKNEIFKIYSLLFKED